MNRIPHIFPRPIVCSVIACALGFASGCARTLVVTVPETDPVMLAEDVRAYVYAQDELGRWVRSSSRVTLRKGLFVLSDPQSEKEVTGR